MVATDWRSQLSEVQLTMLQRVVNRSANQKLRRVHDPLIMEMRRMLDEKDEMLKKIVRSINEAK